MIISHAHRHLLHHLVCCCFIVFSSLSWAGALDEPVAHPAIPVLDESGAHVLNSGQPYSPKTTCGTGGCHDYEQITHSFHFETGRDEARDDFGALRQLPQLVSPGYFGGYNCMGGSNPDNLAKKNNAQVSDFADHGSAGLIKRCISCHSGGGWMEKDRNNRRYDEVNPDTVNPLDGDYFNRGTDENNQSADSSVVSQWNWQKSGVVENDCFLCHFKFDDLKVFDDQVSADTSGYDHFRSVRGTDLAKKGFFRYVDSAILEVMNLNHPDGVTSDKSLLNFSRTDGHLNLDDNGNPLLNWNPDAFDENGKVVIPMLRYPNNDNCMMCHRTSNSRRGFYGFGEDTAMEADAEGIIEEDYQDDVHYGKVWTETNGESRAIENCNSCHSGTYFKPSYSNVDLDSPHQFLKGNSDMDVRNDLDFNPAPKSCEYCHETSPNRAIPSGHDTMLDAHRERWKASSDLQGYTAGSLDRITQTHLDVISCQACHITNKKSRGRPLQILYRYRRGEDNKLKIIPYNPRLRYYWKDKTSGYVMNQTERNRAFRLETDADGNKYGALINPVSGEQLGTVGARMSHGSWRFSDPADYNSFKALKQAYDSVLAEKGLANPDAVMVWTESNYYIMSHNTRLAVDSLQCEQCHERKQNGSFSALVSEQGVLGKENIKQVTTLPDKRLVDEGLVIFDKPYMQVDDSGVVTENIADILYDSKINPSMSILNAEQARVMTGSMHKYALDNAANQAQLGAYSSRLGEQIFTPQAYVFKGDYGDDALRHLALLLEANSATDAIFSTAQIQASLASNEQFNRAQNAGFGGLISSVINLQAAYDNGQNMSQLTTGGQMLLKLPYYSDITDESKIKLIHSDNGNDWNDLNAKLVFVQAQTDGETGFALFLTEHFGYFSVASQNASAQPVAVDTDSSTETTSSGGGGGGSVFLLPILLLLGWRFRGRLSVSK
ncbi:hypothetical protein QUF61_02225 [Candidatus Venteria ishoeyi]|uniref:hypothetical protein n=1 Tax=Candidatus Venteria ishoeyi TaxID=1899563 RepID=UPI0025A5A903|nr:hypothetical protein [Candidatus Venteria ishoeyi]MDM8545288.1 hypothetical protein [Candidatus Venteria ishoeyi]